MKRMTVRQQEMLESFARDGEATDLDAFYTGNPLDWHNRELQRDPTGLGEAVVVQPAAGMAGDDAALAVMPVERIAGMESVEVGRLAITREALQHLLLTYGHAFHRPNSSFSV